MAFIIFTPFGIPVGLSATFWLFVGILRYITEKIEKRLKKPPKENSYKPSDIAVLLPAHNEALVIQSSIRALRQSLNANQLYLASDGSTDNTYELARKEGVHAVQLMPGRGKAKALKHLLEHFHLFDRYKLIFIVDSDTKIDKDFVKNALPLFNDPDIGVVFGGVRIHWPQHIIPRDKLHIVAYRERLDLFLRYFFVYGQTWKYANVSYVIPGFACIYRSDILKQINIDTPGLLIEDFNTAFQVHKKGLTKIGHSPAMIGWDQHPDNLPDYWKQVKRWNIGFFQTVRRNGVWPSMFWLFLAVFSIEVFLMSVFILILPFLVMYLLLSGNPGVLPEFGPFVSLYKNIGPFQHVTMWDIILLFFIVDYSFTVIMGLLHKKPQFIFYGLFFFFMHYVTALILVSSIIPGFFGSSEGRWISPKRRKE